MKETGLLDIEGKVIKTGDITSLYVDGEERLFTVKYKTVKREVLCHEGFDEEYATVNITGVVFEWDGYDLFPCIDENGIPDNEKMKIVGNVYEK